MHPCAEPIPAPNAMASSSPHFQSATALALPSASPAGSVASHTARPIPARTSQAAPCQASSPLT